MSWWRVRDGFASDADAPRLIARGSAGESTGGPGTGVGVGVGSSEGRVDESGPRIVLVVPTLARVVGAAVAAELASGGSGVPVVALWEAGSADVAGWEVDDSAAAIGSARGGDPDPSRRDRELREDVEPDDPPPAPWATRRARLAAADVQAAGVEATATGNTVRVLLPAEEVQAVAAVERVAARPGLDRLVCVVARPWTAPFLRTIERVGTVRVAGPRPSVEACRATLRRHDVEVLDAPRPTGAVAAMLLRRGWASPALIRSSARGDDGQRADGASNRVGSRGARDDAGQALLLVLLGLALAMILAGVLGAVAMAMSGREDQQRAIDVAALAAAAQLRAGSAAGIGASAESTATIRSRAAVAARTTARENGVSTVEVDFPDGDGDGGRMDDAAAGGRPAARSDRSAVATNASFTPAPQQVRVRTTHRPAVVGVVLPGEVTATAEVAVPTYTEAVATGDEYAGPLAIRQGKPMRPDVALAFDRMNAAATAAGHPLTVTSGYRSNAEQARLFAAHPDPKWVARPGTSLHRLGTELDLGPASAYGWLAANSRRFGFLKRYSWEPWHFGFVRETASAHVAEQGRNPSAPQVSGTIPPWVPATYRALIRGASIRFKVSAALISAQLKAESNFSPRVVSSAGAQGIAQFMPGTAAAVGLLDPFDPAQAIPAQAQLMAKLLRRFGSVPLALAAYNAGEGRVGSCHCVPAYPETQRYVARIIALMRGYDDAGDGAGLAIRLVG